MIILVRSNDIISDSRAKKYIDFYKKNNISYKIIAWNRTGTPDKLPHTIYYNKASKYNQGGFYAVIDRIKWMYFVVKTLFSLKRDLKIHACDLDSAYPAVIYKRLSKRSNYVLFDVFDWFSDTLYNQGKLVLHTFKIMEKATIRNSDHIIICEEERVGQIPYNIKGKYSVLQNIPAFDNSEFLFKDNLYRFENNKFTISYVGGFSEDRCLDNLIHGASEGLYNRLIAGYGTQSVIDKLASFKSCPNMKYFGKVSYTDGLRIMYNADLIYAMYSKINPNHIYAAPNKYYEAMFVGKPVITTEGIIVGDKITKNNYGFAIGERFLDLQNLIISLEKNDLLIKSSLLLKSWAVYKDVTANYLKGFYSQLLKI